MDTQQKLRRTPAEMGLKSKKKLFSSIPSPARIHLDWTIISTDGLNEILCVRWQYVFHMSFCNLGALLALEGERENIWPLISQHYLLEN